MARHSTGQRVVGTRQRAAGKRSVRTGGDQVQSLVRALSLLNRLSEAEEGGATLTDLAQQVGLPSSTVHRLLTTLEQERYVRFDQEGRLWSVGVQAFISGNAFTKTRSIVGIARPHMRRLMEESGEMVNLAVEARIDDSRLVELQKLVSLTADAISSDLGGRRS
jgi:IclR family transcriptional regulator, acetate operon repressor